jgi:hypothetical protein
MKVSQEKHVTRASAIGQKNFQVSEVSVACHFEKFPGNRTWVAKFPSFPVFAGFCGLPRCRNPWKLKCLNTDGPRMTIMNTSDDEGNLLLTGAHQRTTGAAKLPKEWMRMDLQRLVLLVRKSVERDLNRWETWTLRCISSSSQSGSQGSSGVAEHSNRGNREKRRIAGALEDYDSEIAYK